MAAGQSQDEKNRNSAFRSLDTLFGRIKDGTFGEILDENLVEDVLLDEETNLPDEFISLIKKGADAHFEEIINGCIQQGAKLSLYPVVFYGGGGLLLAGGGGGLLFLARGGGGLGGRVVPQQGHQGP